MKGTLQHLVESGAYGNLPTEQELADMDRRLKFNPTRMSPADIVKIL